jgi:hypothetical protein
MRSARRRVLPGCAPVHHRLLLGVRCELLAVELAIRQLKPSAASIVRVCAE